MIKKQKCSPNFFLNFVLLKGSWKSGNLLSIKQRLLQWLHFQTDKWNMELTFTEVLPCTGLCNLSILTPSCHVKIDQKYIYGNISLQCSASVRVETTFLPLQQEFCSSLWDCFAVYCVFLESPLEEVLLENFQPQNPRNFLNLQKDPFFSHRSYQWALLFFPHQLKSLIQAWK